MVSHPDTRRFISRNNASAASPRRRCSSGVMSGASPARSFLVVTVAGLRSVGGAALGSSAATTRGEVLSRLLGAVTIGVVIAAAHARFLGGRL